MTERYIFNGGLELGLLEMVNEDGLLSESDKKRMEYLKSLPPNRHEFEIGGKPVFVDLNPAPQQLKSKQ